MRTSAVWFLVPLLVGCGEGGGPGPTPPAEAPAPPALPAPREEDEADEETEDAEPPEARPLLDLRAHDEAIDALWVWWAGHHEALEEQLSNPRGSLLPELSARISAIHPGLAWEFGPGKVARHHLAISPEGDAALRLLTARILARGPGTGAIFEFYGARQRSAADLDDLSLELGGARFTLGELRALVEEDESQELLHLEVWHPSLAAVPEAVRGVALFVMLDNVLGEDALSTWVGAIEPLLGPSCPEGAVGPEELRARLDALEAEATGEAWSTGELTGGDGERGIVVVNRALKRLSHPRFNARLRTTLHLRRLREDGLPLPDELTLSQELEDLIFEAVGSDGVHSGTLTRGGLRRATFFVDPDSGAQARVRAALEGAPREVTVEQVPDLAWKDRF